MLQIFCYKVPPFLLIKHCQKIYCLSFINFPHVKIRAYLQSRLKLNSRETKREVQKASERRRLIVRLEAKYPFPRVEIQSTEQAFLILPATPGLQQQTMQTQAAILGSKPH